MQVGNISQQESVSNNTLGTKYLRNINYELYLGLLFISTYFILLLSGKRKNQKLKKGE